MKENDLKKELKLAIKSGSVYRKDAIRMILGEVPRLNKKKIDPATEEEIDKIIRSLIKSEMIRLTAANYTEDKSEYLSELKSFLPSMMTEKEIKVWILDNVDFNDYIDSKIKAMGPIMKKLNGRADGNIVRKILQKIQ